MALNLSMPGQDELKPRITVFGVGGAGGNAVNNMIEKQLEGVDFVVANTDAQALAQSYGVQLKADDENNKAIFRSLRSLSQTVQAHRESA